MDCWLFAAIPCAFSRATSTCGSVSLQCFDVAVAGSDDRADMAIRTYQHAILECRGVGCPEVAAFVEKIAPRAEGVDMQAGPRRHRVKLHLAAILGGLEQAVRTLDGMVP